MKFSADMRYLLITCFFFLVQAVVAQEIIVMDVDTKEPIVNVAVYNLDKSKTALSDFDGRCDLSVFERNERITFKHISYGTRKSTKSQIQKHQQEFT